MDRRIWCVVLSAGCIESNIRGPNFPPDPIYNPADIENTIVVDRVLQTTTPQADILWMIDNSCSMGNEQDELTQNFPFFMNFFLGSGLDYHIAVTTSDTISNDYPGAAGTLTRAGPTRFITPETDNAVATFQNLANVGVNGTYPERGVHGVFLALEVKADLNEDFIRDDAALHTICISDERDYTLDSVITLPEFIDWYDGIKPTIPERTFSAIVSNQGERYAQVSEAIGGIKWNLTDDDWPELLQQLGLTASGFQQEYFLSQPPIESTIQVEVETPDGAVKQYDPIIDFTYDGARNSITFVEEVPTELSIVRITYQLLSTAQDGFDEIE